MKTILVTGGKGQLAQCIKQASLDLEATTYHFIFADKKKLDITDEESVHQFLEKNKVNCLINCAAYTAVDKAEEDIEIAFKVNAEAVKILSKETKQKGIAFIHISTDYVFGNNVPTPFKEDDAASPKSVYGESKLQGEQWAIEFNPQSLIIRTAWVYSLYGHNFLNTMLRLFKERKEISVVNDQIGTPTNANDLAAAIIQIVLAPSKPSGVYHYTNAGQTSWYGFAQKIKEYTHAHIQINPIPTSAYPTAAQRPLYSVLNTEKIENTFGVKVPKWDESLKNLIEAIN